MGFFSRFEGQMEDKLEGAAGKMGGAPISPVQIAKKAEKAMRRERMVGAGKQYAPTLYTVLVNPQDDQRLFGYYPTLAGETETYLSAKAAEEGLAMDGQPLVRFIVDEDLRHGKFDIIAELVSAPIIEQLRAEEMYRYGLAPAPANPANAYEPAFQGASAAYGAAQPQPQPQPQPIEPLPSQQPRSQKKEPLPYVPEEEIDRSIDYGEYTFNSQDFEDYQENGPAEYTPTSVANNVHSRRPSQPLAQAYAGSNVDLSGLDVQSDYDPNMQSAPFAESPQPVASVQPAYNAAIPTVAPATAVFTPGAGAVAAQPAAQAVRARLRNAATNRSYDLATNRVILGRSSGSDVVLDDINASRSHAELRLEPQGTWIISDLGSTNGTMVNGQRITSQPLREGDCIIIGMTTFVFTTA